MDEKELRCSVVSDYVIHDLTLRTLEILELILEDNGGAIEIANRLVEICGCYCGNVGPNGVVFRYNCRVLVREELRGVFVTEDVQSNGCADL